MVSVGRTRGGGGGGGKLRCSREPTHAGGWMVSVGGTWGGGGWGGVVSFDVHANQLTHNEGDGAGWMASVMSGNSNTLPASDVWSKTSLFCYHVHG